MQVYNMEWNCINSKNIMINHIYTKNPLVSLSSTIYLPFNNEPDLFLVLVMIICPMIINLFVMWIQDNLK